MTLPPLLPATGALDADDLQRYSRQVILPELGVAGQRRLAAARVLVIGAGGLGSPVLQYLAAAGVGTVGIVDSDRVEPSNLHRQVIHTPATIGRPKVDSAAAALRALPGVTVFPSNANFLLVRFPDAAAVFAALKAHGILVRNLSALHPLMANTLRISIGTAAEMDALTAALKQTLAAP